MSETPLEKAARALARLSHEGYLQDQVDEYVEAKWRRRVRQVRAVLLSVREPDEGMIEAGATVIASSLNGDPYDAVNGLLDEATGNDYSEYESAVEAFSSDATAVFTAMIDHILRGGE